MPDAVTRARARARPIPREDRDELSAAASRGATARHGVMPETGDWSHGYQEADRCPRE